MKTQNEIAERIIELIIRGNQTKEDIITHVGALIESYALETQIELLKTNIINLGAKL